MVVDQRDVKTLAPSANVNPEPPIHADKHPPVPRTNVSRPRDDGYTIAPVTGADLGDLVPLMRAYCDFYATAPGDEELLHLARTVLAEPALEGVQLIARDAQQQAVGFASVFWSWDTTEATRIGIMNDLYVAPQARGTGVADELIAACLERCAERGASRLEWQTAPDNARAQAVYARVGAAREPWLVYIREVDRP
jgi:GNAT superfamily N-acetyltransferase